MGSMTVTETAAELVARSNRLGADPRNTNYAGGNTSAKGTATDPVTQQPVDLRLGQGLRRRPRHADRGRPRRAAARPADALVDVYPGVEREDEMVAAFDYCLHGKGGAAPSIDTAMHGLVDAPHVDHLHPDSGIALATAADGEKLTAECFGDRVVWVPWRRPGFQLGLDIAAGASGTTRRPSACILGGHGITAWGDTSAECEANSLEIIRTAEQFLADRGIAEPFGAVVPGFEPLPDGRAAAAGRRARPGDPWAGVDGQPAGRALHRLGRRAGVHRSRASSPSWPRSAPPARTTSCGPRSGRSCSTCRRRAPLEEAVARLKELHAAVPRGLRGLLRPARGRRTARRCAVPIRRSCWCPASACSASARTSRPRGWPASSTSTRST